MKKIRPDVDALDDTLSPLKLKRVGIDTYRENVAYLHRDCALYRAEGFQALSKVEVRANGQRILASLNVVDDTAIVGCGQLVGGRLRLVGGGGGPTGECRPGRAAGLDSRPASQARR